MSEETRSQGLDEAFLRKHQPVSYGHIFNQMRATAWELVEDTEYDWADDEIVSSLTDSYAETFGMYVSIGTYDNPDEYDISDDCKALAEEAIRCARKVRS